MRNLIFVLNLLSFVSVYPLSGPLLQFNPNVHLTLQTGSVQKCRVFWSRIIPKDILVLDAFADDFKESEDSGDERIYGKTKSSRIERIKNFAKTIIVRPIGTAAPKAIADILTDATYGAVDLAVDEVSKVASYAATAGSRIIRSRAFSKILEEEATLEGDTNISLDKIALAKTSIADAFLVAEQTIRDAEAAITRSKQALILVSHTTHVVNFFIHASSLYSDLFRSQLNY